MNGTGLKPAEAEAVKKEIMASMHCSLPGRIKTFDAETGRASVELSVKIKGYTMPDLPDVPVYMPYGRTISEGDRCILVFSDIDLDAWLAEDTDNTPCSERMHSLSDAVAFVGFDSHSVPIDIVSKYHAGLCPRLPDETGTDKYLCENGEWSRPQDTEYTAGTGLALSNNAFSINSTNQTILSRVSKIRFVQKSALTKGSPYSFTMPAGTQGILLIGAQAPINILMSGTTLYKSGTPTNYTISNSGNTVTVSTTNTSSVAVTVFIIST